MNPPLVVVVDDDEVAIWWWDGARGSGFEIDAEPTPIDEAPPPPVRISIAPVDAPRVRTVAWVLLLLLLLADAVGCEASKSPESRELKRARVSWACAWAGAVVGLVVVGAPADVDNLEVEAKRSGAV